MKKWICLFVLFIGFCCISDSYGASVKKILVVSSYHREYAWSQETNKGFCAALLKFRYLDNKNQITQYTKNDYVESSRAIIKKLWMDTKRKKSKEEIAQITLAFTKIILDFNPDIIFLGDDNAANYIGNQFLDSKIPVVFWGMNNNPLKYGLIEKLNKPGHNVTGVYQPNFFKESLQLLKKLVPTTKTFVLLSDDSKTSRSNAKSIAYLAHKGELPLKLVDTIATDNFDAWKTKVLELQQKTDAFFIAHYAGFKDKDGKYVPPEEAASWYLTHVTIPEAMSERQFVEQGILCTADDSGYNQGYEAVIIAHDILANGADPATYPPRAPKRGPLIVNQQRAKMLGITLTNDMGIEEYIETASALKDTTTLSKKKRILVVDSYHREYIWSQGTNKGFCAAMLKFGYFDNQKQIAWYTENDSAETSTMIIKKVWMDSKKKSSKSAKEKSSIKAYQIVKEFRPDLIFLGDDNAANYIGNQFLDTEIPIVFWGVNNTPVKYGLVDSKERPGHNVTGVYQSGYYAESLKLLTKIVPTIKTFAVLSVANPTGRSHYKALEYLHRNGALPITLKESVITENYAVWQRKALELQNKVDAFFLAHYSGLKDSTGKYVPTEKVAAWYLNNIKIPEAVGQVQFINNGMLCGADDSAYNQGFEAVNMAHDILANGANPASYLPRTPARGKFMANKKRAKMLGITLTKGMGIEEYIE